MPQGGELVIEVRPEEDKVRIVIRDSGKGMEEGRIGRAAEPFYTTKMIGTGMGLTLVKRIVEDHGGSLILESGNDGGMQATILLPGPTL
jgi:signal transduction histidine kinase